MLQLSEQEGAIYGDAETKNCTQVLHQKCMYVESSPTPPPCGDCAMGREIKHCSLTPSVEQRRSVPGREESRMMREDKSNHHTNAPQFQEKSKTCRGQNKWPNRRQKNYPFSSFCCHSFSHLLSLKVKMPFPFRPSSRINFKSCIVIPVFFNRDSSLKALEAGYNFVSL